MEALGIDPPVATKLIIGLPTWLVGGVFLLILLGLIVKEIAVGDAVFKIALNLTVAVAMLSLAAIAAVLLRLLPAY